MESNEIAIIDEQNIKDMVYEVRGQRVMLDFDLAKIYGYTTSAFNQQVKNNIDRFPEEFRFRLTRREVDDLPISKIFTSAIPSRFFSQKGGSAHLPYAFTEQGVYMLMTVLKGELAVKQSIALIKAFKALKDAAIAGAIPLPSDLLPIRLGALEEKVEAQGKAIKRGRKEVGEIKSELSLIIDRFQDPVPPHGWLIRDGERVEAAIAYQSIYAKAEKTVLVIDDYIGKETLHLLKACRPGVSITLASDNRAALPLGESDLTRFAKDGEGNNPITLLPTNGRFHDRYIFLDYGTDQETLYHCGTSSKDAGGKVTTIMRIENPIDYHRLIDALLAV